MVIHQLDRKTLFVPLEVLFNECREYIADTSGLYPFKCFVAECSADNRCMEKLAPKVKQIFTALSGSDMLVVYWRVPNDPQPYACKFCEDMKEPEMFEINEGNLTQFLKMSEAVVVDVLAYDTLRIQ